MLIHGKEDDIVDPKQATDSLTVLKQAGIPANIVPAPGAGHAFINEPVDELASYTAHVTPRGVAVPQNRAVTAGRLLGAGSRPPEFKGAGIILPTPCRRGECPKTHHPPFPGPHRDRRPNVRTLYDEAGKKAVTWAQHSEIVYDI